MATLPQFRGSRQQGESQAAEFKQKLPVSRRKRVRGLPPHLQLELAEELEMHEADYVAETRGIHKTDIIETAVRKLQREMRHVMSIGLLRGMPELRRPVQSERRDGFGRRLPNGGVSRDGESAA